MKITVANAKSIVKRATKRIDTKTNKLVGYDLDAFYRFRNVFICKDAVSGNMLMDSKGTISEDVKYYEYEASETALKILGLN